MFFVSNISFSLKLVPTATSAKMGLVETKLAIIPGAGKTDFDTVFTALQIDANMCFPRIVVHSVLLCN